jgi:hypothetical protein
MPCWVKAGLWRPSSKKTFQILLANSLSTGMNEFHCSPAAFLPPLPLFFPESPIGNRPRALAHVTCIAMHEWQHLYE